MCVGFLFYSPLDTQGFRETTRVIACLALTQIWCQGVIKLRSHRYALLLSGVCDLSLLFVGWIGVIRSCLLVDSTQRLMRKVLARSCRVWSFSFSSPLAAISMPG